jgi:hypothetical protein
MDKPVLCSEQMPPAGETILGFFPKSQRWMTVQWYPKPTGSPVDEGYAAMRLSSGIQSWFGDVWLAPGDIWYAKESVSHWAPGPVVSQAEDTALRERVAAVTKGRDAALISRAFYEELNTIQVSLRLREERDEAIRERDEARAQLEARDRIAREERKRWDSDPPCKQLDHHRQRMGGMLPGDACFIANMQSRVLQAEAERDALRKQVVELSVGRVFCNTTAAQSYDSLARLHKQGAWNLDQERHFDVGWEAAVLFYRLVPIPNA